ncbi:MAG: hypothetical protein V4857_31315 [Pseudomonadota bacterium]
MLKLLLCCASVLLVGCTVPIINDSTSLDTRLNAPVTHKVEPGARQWKYVDALIKYDPLPPCRPSKNTLALVELAARMVELAEGPNSLALEIGAQQYLGLNPCAGPDIMRRVGTALESSGNFGKYRQSEYNLTLAFRLPPSAHFAAAVAKSAFERFPQESDALPDHDIRPYARTILARFPEHLVRPYGADAFNEISAENALGTGAAQVATAAGHPGSLERIASLVEAGLSQFSLDGTWMSHDRHKRLVELMWSFEFAGEPGKAYLARLCPPMRRVHWPGAVGGSPKCLR